jgi:hypothetical protein
MPFIRDGNHIVQYSPNPIFDLSLGTTQIITLSGDAAASIINSLTKRYTFVVIQDSNGNHTFTWPSNFRGAGPITPLDDTAEANTIATQTFDYIYFLNQFVATSPIVYGI